MKVAKTKQKEGTEVPDSVLEAERKKLYKDLGIDSDIEEERKKIAKRRRWERKFVAQKQMELFGYTDENFEFSQQERRRIDSVELTQEQLDKIKNKKLSDEEKVKAVALSEEELKEIDGMTITDEERKRSKERL